MNESSGVLALLAAGVPRERDLISLQELSSLLAEYAKIDSLPAQQKMIYALRGIGEFAGLPLSLLIIYHKIKFGYIPLSTTSIAPDGFKIITSRRSEALKHIAFELEDYGYIDDIPDEGRFTRDIPGKLLFVDSNHALKAFGLPDLASLHTLPLHASAAIQSDPTPAQEQPDGHPWKIGRFWTEEALAEMRRQRADDWNDGRIAKHWGFERQNVARLIGSRSANKAKANTPKR